MSVIIDGGGHVSMGDLLADIRLKAVRANNRVLWQLMLGGTEANALQVGLLRTDHAADVVIDLLTFLAKRGSDARGRDLDIGTVRAICADRLLENYLGQDFAAGFFSPPGRRWAEGSDEGASSPPPLTGAPSSRCRDLLPLGEKTESGTLAVDKEAHQYGLMRLSQNLSVAALAPAYGQLPAKTLSSLCTVASTLGINITRPGPAHALYCLGNEEACQSLLVQAHQAGFVTNAHDPRSAIAVCAGEPACASAFIATRELAEHAAEDCAALLDGSITLHLSGCGKGCAHPTAAPLAFSGSSEGLAFRYSGRVSDAPDVILPFTEQKAALSRLARLYEKEHKPGENARALLARLGRQKIVAALRQDDR
jgi:precorrin-3B synthase